jgi:PAS domain S-box-containing protein
MDKNINDSETKLSLLSKNDLIEEIKQLQRELQERTGTLEQVNAELKQEIAKHLQTEEALLLTQFSVDHAADIIFWIGSDGKFIYANEEAYEALGYSHEELLSMKLYEVELNFSADIWEDYWEVNRELGSVMLETEYRRKDTTTFPVEVTENYFQFKNQEYICFSVRDISERKQADIELKQHRDHLEELVAKRTEDWAMVNKQLEQDIAKRKQVEEKLRKFSRVVEQSGNTIVITDLNGTIEFVNPTFCTKTGYSYAEAIGQNPRLLKSGFQSKEFYQELWATISSGKVWQGEMLNKRKNGEFYWEFATISPIKDDAGNNTHYLAIKEDITERKKALEELKIAKEMAESANQAKSTFLASMSHELRTPLNGILGYTQILNREKNLTKRQKDGIKIIQRSGEHLLMLINDILDISKIEADKLEIKPNDFKLSSFLKEIAELFRMRIEEKGIEFFAEINLPLTIHADEKRLRQILLNLLSNAAKFTQQGQITFKVSQIQEFIRFEVEDSGIGISPNHLETIFLPFQQVGENNLQQAEGTGLGLAISKKMVEMMGGQLQVESKLGIGSRFWFDIPLVLSNQTLPDKKPEQREIVGFKAQKSDFKILVVDDKWENRILLNTLLMSLNFNVLDAKNGEEALTKAYQFSPDAIIMDIKMPIMDGIECTRRLRQDAKFEKTVIIALSANVFDEQQEETLEVGCNAFVSKPLNTEKFLQLLGEHCSLEWIYETETVQKKPVAIVPPDIESSQALFKLARSGNIQGVITKAEELLESNPDLQGFVEEVCHLANNFQMTQLKNFLKQYIG